MSSPRKGLRGKVGGRIAEIDIMMNEGSEQDMATTSLEEGGMSDLEVQDEIDQGGSETIGMQDDRGSPGVIGKGEIMVIGSDEVDGEMRVISGGL